MGAMTAKSRQSLYGASSLTTGTIIGGLLTLLTAGSLAFLVFFASEFHSTLAMINLIVFQLCFIWTCAGWLDGASEDPPDDIDPADHTFTP
jgi:hypothetical protein